MSINWETFQDIEEFQTNSHSSGIQDYILGIGMSFCFCFDLIFSVLRTLSIKIYVVYKYIVNGQWKLDQDVS